MARRRKEWTPTVNAAALRELRKVKTPAQLRSWEAKHGSLTPPDRSVFPIDAPYNDGIGWDTGLFYAKRAYAGIDFEPPLDWEKANKEELMNPKAKKKKRRRKN